LDFDSIKRVNVLLYCPCALPSFMLQFEPRFNVFVLALASRQKIQSRVNNPGKHRAGVLTVIIIISPHRTTLNTSNTDT